MSKKEKFLKKVESTWDELRASFEHYSSTTYPEDYHKDAYRIKKEFLKKVFFLFQAEIMLMIENCCGVGLGDVLRECAEYDQKEYYDQQLLAVYERLMYKLGG